MERDVVYISRALELAAKARGSTFPNPLVGAVVVKDDRVVAEGYHRRAGEAHAEAEALASAGDEAAGATLYLNLEPCCHHGNTPPCTDAIVRAGINRVVFSILDPDERVRGEGARNLRENGIRVDTGTMAAEAVELNLPYLHQRIAGKPLVIIKLALTLDGKLTADGRRWITSEDSRRYVHEVRASCEAIATGIGTVRCDDPSLDRRLYDPSLGPPVRMVFDSGLSFDPDHRWIGEDPGPVLYCTGMAPDEKKEMLTGRGAEVVVLPEDAGGVDLVEWLEDVKRRGVGSVLIEAGPAIASSCVSLGIFDRLILMHGPVFSGEAGKGWYGLNGDRKLVLSRCESIGDDILAVYDRKSISRYVEKLR